MRIALFVLIVLASSCGKLKFFKKSSQEKQDVSKIYASGTLKVNVFYEEGAEPYTSYTGTLLGVSVSGVQSWNVLQENLKAMFPGKTVIVPKELSSMSKIGDQGKSPWSYSELDELGKNIGEPSVGDVSVFNIFFLKGHSDQSNGIIGVHLSGTKTLAIFKDVVENSGGSAFVKTYVEQATLVHEMGHAVGLVNNGLPLTSSHEDTGHRAHCSNPKCVMYWSNEGFNSMMDFLESRRDNPSAVMLDDACLKDVTSYK